MLHEICKDYRKETGTKQHELGNVKNISAFENGRSSNINYMQLYLELAKSRNELDLFLKLIKEGVNND